MLNHFVLIKIQLFNCNKWKLKKILSFIANKFSKLKTMCQKNSYAKNKLII